MSLVSKFLNEATELLESLRVSGTESRASREGTESSASNRILEDETSTDVTRSSTFNVSEASETEKEGGEEQGSVEEDGEGEEGEAREEAGGEGEGAREEKVLTTGQATLLRKLIGKLDGGQEMKVTIAGEEGEKPIRVHVKRSSKRTTKKIEEARDAEESKKGKTAESANKTNKRSRRQQTESEKKEGQARLVIEEGVKGTVKWYNVLSRYGFIERDDGRGEVFVHQRAIAASDILKQYLRTLEEGEPVEFNVIAGAHGPEATAVTGPEGRPVKGSRRFYLLFKNHNRDANRAASRTSSTMSSSIPSSATDISSFDISIGSISGSVSGSGSRSEEGSQYSLVSSSRTFSMSSLASSCTLASED